MRMIFLATGGRHCCRGLEPRTNTPDSPGSPAFASRVRVIVHPFLFWSVFDATNRTCIEFAIGLFSNAT